MITGRFICCLQKPRVDILAIWLLISLKETLEQELLLQSRAMQSKALIVGEEQTTRSPNTFDKLMTKFFDGEKNNVL